MADIRLKHTPGPWIIDMERSDEGDIVVLTSKARTICEVHNHAGVDPEDVEANARLIARAPEMDEEIQRLRAVNAELVALGELFLMPCAYPHCASCVKNRELLCAALEKARQ